MITYYKTDNCKTCTIDAPEPGCWISVYEPTEDDLRWLRETLDISDEFLSSGFDEEETAHTAVNSDNGQVLAIVDCPYIVSTDQVRGETIKQYDTLPISFVMIPEKEYMVTLSLHKNEVIERFANEKCSEIDTASRTEFLLKALLFICEDYLSCLRELNREIRQFENLLGKSMRDDDLLTLLGFEKSLVYFTASLKGMSVTVSQVDFERRLGISEDDRELLGEVKIEVGQASEMCAIYTNILEGLTDAFSNVLNNNLNITMRTLTIITIIVAMPTIVVGFYGMNIAPLPFGDFWLWPAIISVLLCVLVFLLLKYGRLLK